MISSTVFIFLSLLYLTVSLRSMALNKNLIQTVIISQSQYSSTIRFIRINSIINIKKQQNIEPMKELIVLQIGQGGIQLGKQCWELFCLQHNISPNGQLSSDQNQNHCETLYSQSSKGNYVPRSIFIDLQPSVIDEIKSGTYKKLYHPSNLISGKEDAANIFAKGIHTTGKNLIDKIQHRMRKQAQKCQNFQGFLLFSALGGGTGSGLGSLILDRLSYDFNKKSKICFNIFPSPKLSTSCVEPYNAVLGAHNLRQLSDVCVVFDNESLYKICQRKLNIDQPNYKSINRLIAHSVSSITYSARFNGLLNCSLDQFQTNLVPYPRIQFMQSSYSPFISSQRQYIDKMNTSQLTHSLFDSSNMMAASNYRKGKYIACCLNYRGDIAPNEVFQTLCSIRQRKTVEFVDWCPTGFKVGINTNQPSVIPGGQIGKTMSSCSMISNSTSISTVFDKMGHKFDSIYAKRAFYHYYSGEGMSGGQFRQAREDMAVLSKDYEEIEQLTAQEE